MLELVLIRGLPGSGKSTLAQRLLEPLDAVHMEADMFWGPDYDFDLSRLKEAHEWCLQETSGFIGAGVSVVVSNTFTQLWEMQPYGCVADVHQARLSVLVCERAGRTIHPVPDEAIARMRARWEPWDGYMATLLGATRG